MVERKKKESQRKKKKRKKRKPKEEIGVLDKCIEMREIEMLIAGQWKIVIFPVSFLKKEGILEKEDDQTISKYLETEFNGFDKFLFTGDKEKKKKYFLPSKKECVIRLAGGTMNWDKLKKIELIKKFLVTLHQPKQLLGKEVYLTSDKIIIKYRSGNTRDIKYREA
jgi:hypothetical protein